MKSTHYLFIISLIFILIGVIFKQVYYLGLFGLGMFIGLFFYALHDFSDMKDDIFI